MELGVVAVPGYHSEDSLMLFLKAWTPLYARCLHLKPASSSYALSFLCLVVGSFPVGWGGGASLLMRKFISSCCLPDAFWGLDTPTTCILTYIHSKQLLRSILDLSPAQGGAKQTLTRNKVLSFVFRRLWIIANKGGRKEKWLLQCVFLVVRWLPAYVSPSYEVLLDFKVKQVS